MVQDSGSVIVYVDDNGKPQVDVRFQDETVWLTQAQLVDLSLILRQLFGNSEQFETRVIVR